MGLDVLGVAGVDVLPSLLHAGDFGGVVKLLNEGIGEFCGGGAGKHASDVHVRVAETSKAKINYADDFVIFV